MLQKHIPNYMLTMSINNLDKKVQFLLCNINGERTSKKLDLQLRIQSFCLSIMN